MTTSPFGPLKALELYLGAFAKDSPSLALPEADGGGPLDATAGMAAISRGQRFDSLQDFKRALRAWAIADKLSPAILDSDSRRVRVGCRSCRSCAFRIRCNYTDGSGAVVTTFHGVCEAARESRAGLTDSSNTTASIVKARLARPRSLGRRHPN